MEALISMLEIIQITLRTLFVQEVRIWYAMVALTMDKIHTKVGQADSKLGAELLVSMFHLYDKIVLPQKRLMSVYVHLELFKEVKKV